MNRYQRNIAQHGDALELLDSLPDACTPLAFFDPQHRSTLDHLKYGNEGARQRERCALPAMTDFYIDACVREIARVLTPSGYLMAWEDTFRLLEGYHQQIRDILKAVDLIAWDNERIGNGYRSRRRGAYLLVLQKPPLAAKRTWTDHAIPDRWIEKVDRKAHPHVKPRGLTERLIGATTQLGDLVIDPAGGSFVVMHAALELGREFIGCDLTYEEPRKLMELKMTDDDESVRRLLDEASLEESGDVLNKARDTMRTMSPKERAALLEEFHNLCARGEANERY